MSLIFNVLNDLLDNCGEALLSSNKRRLAEFVRVVFMLKIILCVQIACQKTEFYEID